MNKKKLVSYKNDGVLSVSAEAIKQSIPVFSHICKNKEQRILRIRECRNNIEFAKSSLMIDLYCGASTINWDEKVMRDKIKIENYKMLDLLKVGEKENKCIQCRRTTERRGKQKGTGRMYFCSIECEDEYLENDKCIKENCNKPAFCRNLCKLHYNKWYNGRRNIINLV